MQFASQGASAIVSLVMAAVEALAKTICKLVEIVKMRAVFAQARELSEARLKPDSLHLRPIAFNAWFTGICGDKMHFIKMFKDDDAVVTQAQFDAGCRYIDSLKAWGSDYLKESGFGFKRRDQVVKGLLTRARKHEDESSPLEQVWKATLGS